jgi:hypothetical protein
MSIRTQLQYSSYAALTSASRFSRSAGMSSTRPITNASTTAATTIKLVITLVFTTPI